MYKMPTRIATRPQTIVDSQTENIMKLEIYILLLAIGLSAANPMPPQNSLQRAVTFTQPTQPLEFRQKARKKPKKKNLKKSRLLRKMGLDFDSEWMSVDEPANADVYTVSGPKTMNYHGVGKLSKNVSFFGSIFLVTLFDRSTNSEKSLVI